MATTGRLRDLEGQQQQLLRLVELSVTLNSTLNLETLLQVITGTATELLDCEGASILLYDEKTLAYILLPPQVQIQQNWRRFQFQWKAASPELYSARTTPSS